MTPLFAYLLKMFLVSGVLYTYYHLVLRDNRFHAWNRFYLLSAVLLSLTLPLFHIPVHSTQTSDNRLLFAVWQLLGKNNTGTVQATGPVATGITWMTLLSGVYVLWVLIQLGIMGVHLWRLRRLRLASPAGRLDGITLVTTEDRGTPFSFFRWIFWNRSLELDSAEGRRMLTHELTHVREGHSVDKVILQVVCAFFFPILPLHLMRKELQLIHEYLADQQATQGGDISTYAELLVSTAFGTSPYAFANNFFQHPLRRRLAMMTKFSNPRFTYVRKLMFLPLTLLLFGLLAFRVEKDHPLLTIHFQQAAARLEQDVLFTNRLPVVTPPPPPPSRWKTRVTLPDTTPMAQPLQAVTVTGYAQPKTAQPLQAVTVTGYAAPKTTDTVPPASAPEIRIGRGGEETVLWVINGKMVKDRSQMPALDPNQIQSISVLKNEAAIAKYGQTGQNGVIEVWLKGYTGSDMPATDDKIFTKVEVEAQFPGGDIAWNDYVRKSLIANMDQLKDDKKSGTCEVMFIVDKNGAVSDVQAQTMQGSVLAQVSVDLVVRGPHWIPATQNGHPVKAFRKQKISFQMPD
ncbi:energy transducer TonB [Dinghuibacter silviterrae]|uniref:Beta-lactamase regulating signal transducer with metallopeptidase domain n=1 Tax=Dinghuibacter silviterrae TaxID=1539049 RepID=A0A4V6QA05_9BACT|nr:energy transducer TonB [Dinghuibacter silviterrae]TDX01653.1 beta-lactamase regulating signal transducer with metallopeptidase domain [Dinghuibacter silviterrae]